jgi:hypothetical protein
MPRIVNLINQKFERLLVIKKSKNTQKGRTLWICLCDCGNIVEVVGYALKSGNTKSCGCYNSEQAYKRAFKHGFSPNAKSSKGYSHIYNTWVLIKQRCYNPDNPDYINYGERGISMFAAWINDFDAFNKYVESLPETLEQFELRTGEKGTLDRKDNNGNYEPGNLHWASRETQARNKRNNVVLSINEANKIRLKYQTGTYTEEQLAIEYNCSRSAISAIIHNRSWT